MTKQRYFDYNATTPVHPEVIKQLPTLLKIFGNASSIHQYGQAAREEVESAREALAIFLGGNSDQYIFTGSGTESNNMVLKTLLTKKIAENKDVHLITSKIEHSSVTKSAKYLESMGIPVTYISVDQDGIINLEELEKAIQPNTNLISIMAANNETGAIQPIKEIVEIAKKHEIKVHTDAVQIIGKLPLNVETLGVDFLSLSGHKIYAPKGIGALYLKNDESVRSLIHGGNHEKNLRAGTQNTPLIAALKIAVQNLEKEMDDIKKKLTPFKSKLIKGLQKTLSSVVIHGDPNKTIYNTLNISFGPISGETLLMTLDLKGFAISSGSACSSGSIDPSKVLTAMNVSKDELFSSIRISMGRETTEEDVDALLETLCDCIPKMSQ